MGYEPVIIKELMVSSSRETFVNIEMKENLMTIEELVVKPKISKEEPINKMAMVSARMLSVEEAKKICRRL